jgi:hypothetical protein
MTYPKSGANLSFSFALPPVSGAPVCPSGQTQATILTDVSFQQPQYFLSCQQEELLATEGSDSQL